MTGAGTTPSRRRPVDVHTRPRGLARVATVTTCVALGGGAATLTVAVALAVTRPAAAHTVPPTSPAGLTGPAGPGTTTLTPTRREHHRQGAGIAPGGASPPSAQSAGS